MRALILTEGGRDIGFGHITRCFSLYQAFLNKGITADIIIKGDNSVENILKGVPYRIFDWLKERKKIFSLSHGVDIALIDSYLADYSFYKSISDIIEIPVYIDDNKRLAYPRGVVVNGSIYAKNINYPMKEENIYLLGNEYVPLRKEFWSVPKKKIRKKVKSVMVTFGGEDAKNMTPWVLRLLIEMAPDLNKIVIIGGGFRNIKNIETIKDNRIKRIYFPCAEMIKNIMLGVDIAISACGQTLNELARVGVPTIAVAVAKNQHNNVKGWQKSGFIEYAGSWKDGCLVSNLVKNFDVFSSYEVRVQRKKIGSSLIDGKGAERITNSLFN